MSLATSANEQTRHAVPSNAGPLMRTKRTLHGCRFWSVHDRSEKSVTATLFSTLPISPARKSPARLR
jgi:hypothetical protein